MSARHRAAAIAVTVATSVAGPLVDLHARAPGACESCTLRVELAAAKPSFEVGEPVRLVITLTNIGSRPVDILQTTSASGRPDYRFEVFDGAGNQTIDPAMGFSRSSLGSYRHLAPGAASVQRVVLNYHAVLSTPGRYDVIGSFSVATAGGVIHPEAASIEVTVEPTPPERLQERTSAALRNLNPNSRESLAVLAFTGDSSVMPSLVDLLYHRDDGVQAAAVDALRYFDRAAVCHQLLETINRRGPRSRMIEFLVGLPEVQLDVLKPLLLDALRSANANGRAAAIFGLDRLNRTHDPEIFAPLAAMLADPNPSVRHQASIAVGGYADDRALLALRPVVADADPTVSEQATIAVGWVAQAAAVGSETRSAAVALLHDVAASGRGLASDQALSWLAKVEAK